MTLEEMVVDIFDLYLGEFSQRIIGGELSEEQKEMARDRFLDVYEEVLESVAGIEVQSGIKRQLFEVWNVGLVIEDTIARNPQLGAVIQRYSLETVLIQLSAASALSAISKIKKFQSRFFGGSLAVFSLN